MSTIDPLRPDDFPLFVVGQFVYRRSSSSPFIGPVSIHLADDIAHRLNRDYQAQVGSSPSTWTMFSTHPEAKGGEA